VKFVQDNNITFEKNLQAIMKKSIQSSLAPAAIGPYSQAIEINGYVYLSGSWELTLQPVSWWRKVKRRNWNRYSKT
jgi:hypothetical protein